MSSAAASRSPFVSTSAFLHSIMPAPVRSRSCFTASAVMFIREESSFSAAALATTGSARGAARRGYLRGGRADCSGRGSRDFLCIQVLVIHHRATLNNRSDNRHTRDRRPAPSASTRLLTHSSRRTRASTLLLTRIASLVELHELVFAGRHRGHRFLAFEDRIRDASGIQTNRAHGVVVTGDHVVDAVRGAIRVDNRDDRDAELGGFVNRDLLVTDIDDEQGVREGVHVLDAAQASLELVHLAAQLGGFFLTALVERAGNGEVGDLAQALDRLADGLEVREHAAEPALVHEGLAGADRLSLYGLARGTLRADAEDGAPIADNTLNERGGLCIKGLRLLEVDDVNSVAFAKDERGHLRVPEAGLVSEMDTRFQHLSHGHAGHSQISCLGWASAYPSWPPLKRGSRAPSHRRFWSLHQ